MYKNYFYFLLGLLLLLGGCQQRTEGILTVLDSQNQPVFETTNSQSLDRLAGILEVISEEEEDEETWIELPDDAEVSYSYDIAEPRGGVSIHFTAYKNYPYISISDTPAVPEITIEMTRDEAAMLNHPEQWVK